MGQKINSNIIRIGKKNNSWNSKYIEKKFRESYIYTFKDQEIKKYIKKFLKNHDLILHNYKLNYLDSSLDLFISYYSITNKSSSNLKTKKTSILTVNSKPKPTQKSKKLQKRILKTLKYKKYFKSITYEEYEKFSKNLKNSKRLKFLKKKKKIIY